MFKRLNAGILNTFKRIKLRSFGATVLGGFAGLSLTSNIIPSAMSFTGISDNFSVRWNLGGYAVYAVMIWAVGGWAVQKAGCKKLGALILGTVGLGSGLFLAVIGIGTDLLTLATCGGAALLYGAIGGMIIGDSLRNPPPAEGELHPHPAANTKAKDVRLFRFFTK